MSLQNSPRPNIRLSKQLGDLLDEKLYVEAKILLELTISNPDTTPLIRFSALNTLTCVYLRLGYKSDALKLINNALSYKASMNKLQLICTLINMSGTLSALNEHDNAYKYLLKTLEYITQYADQQEFIALIMYNISIELKFLKKNEESMTYLEKGWKIINTHLPHSHLRDLYRMRLPKTTIKIQNLDEAIGHEKIKSLHPKERHLRANTFTKGKSKTHALSPGSTIRIHQKSLSVAKSDSSLKKPIVGSTRSMKITNSPPMNSRNSKIPSINGSEPNSPRQKEFENRISKIATHINSLEKHMVKFTTRVLTLKGEIGTELESYYLIHEDKIEKIQKFVKLWFRKRSRAASVLQKGFRKFRENRKVVRFKENPLFFSTKKDKPKGQGKVLVKKIRK